MPRVASHTHKLKRHSYKSTGNKVYHCILPDCFFKIDVPLALGKRTLCWRCGREFILNEYSIRLARPHCNDCQKTREEKEEAPTVVAATQESISNLKDRLQKSLSAFAVKEEEL